MRLRSDGISKNEKFTVRDIGLVQIKHHDSSPVGPNHLLAAVNPTFVASILELEPATPREALAFPLEKRLGR
jgi:hypothetical protein